MTKECLPWWGFNWLKAHEPWLKDSAAFFPAFPVDGQRGWLLISKTISLNKRRAKFKTTRLLSKPQPVGGVKQFCSCNRIHYEMRVKRFSAVAEFVGLFCASGLRKRLIEVMLGMASPHLAFHFVNKGIFSGVVSNKGKMRALLFTTRNSVCWLLNIWVNRS